MKRLLEYRVVILVMALAALFGLGYLAAALRHIEFHAPQPLGFDVHFSGQSAGGGGGLEMPFWKVILFVLAIMALLALVMFLLDPELRKRLLLRLIRLAGLAAVCWLLVSRTLGQQAQENTEAAAPPAGGGAAFSSGNAVYVPPQVAPWLIYGLSFGLALLLVLVGWWVYRLRRKKAAAAPLEALAGIARETLDGLADGRNWEDAIVQCYVRMNRVVSAQRGLVRQLGMTPTEFATRMEQAGLPGEAIRTLTRLFEQVRYGGQASSAEDRNLAVAALSAILRTCGNADDELGVLRYEGNRFSSN
jgi:hypothetical protein